MSDFIKNKQTNAEKKALKKINKMPKEIQETDPKTTNHQTKDEEFTKFDHWGVPNGYIRHEEINCADSAETQNDGDDDDECDETMRRMKSKKE